MKKTSMLRSSIVLIIVITLAIVASTAMAEAATIKPGAKLSLIAPVSGTFEMGQAQTVNWSSTNYGSPTVSIRLIRKVSSNPNRYELVRTIAESTANDGIASWIPSAVESGTRGLSLQIGCVSSTFACQAGNSTDSTIAVIRSTRYSNAASAFRALEAANNR